MTDCERHMKERVLKLLRSMLDGAREERRKAVDDASKAIASASAMTLEMAIQSVDDL